MRYYNGQLALASFFVSIIFFVLWEQVIIAISGYCDSYAVYLHWFHIFNYGMLCFINKFIYFFLFHEVCIRAYFLGYCFSSGIYLYLTMDQSWRIFGIYAAALSLFHLTEYLAIAFSNPTELSYNNFLINHSAAYTFAVAISWAEFLIENYFFPTFKSNIWISLFGIAICFFGEMLRKLAIFTAKRNFNHIVHNKKAYDHTLVTHGIYSICRHPSYVGWFYWSVGTQVILQNPLCFLAYAVISWKFLHDRIIVEELSLIHFFGNEYLKYQKKVRTGLPFIHGCTDFEDE